MSRLHAHFLCGSILLLLSACQSQSLSDAQKFIAEVKKKPTPPIEPLPKWGQAKSLFYTAQDLKSPFQKTDNLLEALKIPRTLSGLRPEPNRIKSVLENWPLDALKMVGYFEMEQKKYGMIQDKNGFIHSVTRNEYLGQNEGKIREITEHAIFLTELISDGNADWKKREAILLLSEPS